MGALICTIFFQSAFLPKLFGVNSAFSRSDFVWVSHKVSLCIPLFSSGSNLPFHLHVARRLAWWCSCLDRHVLQNQLVGLDPPKYRQLCRSWLDSSRNLADQASGCPPHIFNQNQCLCRFVFIPTIEESQSVMHLWLHDPPRMQNI